jgi:hypothetical protein
MILDARGGSCVSVPAMATFRAGRRRVGATWAFLLAAVLATGAAAASCSLGNIARVDCTGDTQCAAAFGAGSRCEAGYCSAASSAGCDQARADGISCFGCSPKTTQDFQNACSEAACAPFDAARLTKLTADGGLPPLPAKP